MKGWVYVITNKAMPSLVKVGYSTKDPKSRAKEMGNTGSPHPYIVAYEALVENPYNIEQAVHKRLKASNEGKEWFRITTNSAIEAIKQIAGTGIMYQQGKYTPEEKEQQINNPYTRDDYRWDSSRNIPCFHCKKQILLSDTHCNHCGKSNPFHLNNSKYANAKNQSNT